MLYNKNRRSKKLKTELYKPGNHQTLTIQHLHQLSFFCFLFWKATHIIETPCYPSIGVDHPLDIGLKNLESEILTEMIKESNKLYWSQ